MKFDDYIIPLVEILAPIVTALLGWLSYRLSEYIKSKTKSQRAALVADRLCELLGSLVAEAEQTLVSEMKRSKRSTSEDGARLTKSEAAGVRLAVLTKAKTYLGKKGLDEITSALSVEREAVSHYLETKVEQAVLNLKLRKES